MHKVGAVGLIAAILILISISPAVGVDSATLVEDPDRHDGKMITFTGEAVGDLMRRRDGAWLNVNDDAYSRQGGKLKLAGTNSGIGILIPHRLATKVKRLGDYNNRGDLIEVRGIFHEACPDHGGDIMIHARSLKVVKRGFAVDHPLLRNKLILAATWLALCLGVVTAWWAIPRAGTHRSRAQR